MAAAAGACISGGPVSCSLKQNLAPTRTSNLGSVSLTVKGVSYPSLRLKQGQYRFRVTCAAKPETVETVCAIVKKQLALSPDSAVTGESKLQELGADSLDTVEIVMGLEEAFGITVTEESAQTISTIQEAADLIEELKGSKAA